MHRGWIKLWRRIEDHWSWKRPYSELQAWLYLIMRASYKDKILSGGSDKVQLRRGQLITSQERLAHIWGWSRGKVRRFVLKLCSKSEPETDIQTDGKMTILTIRNYEIYQSDEPDNEQVNGHKTDRLRTGCGHKEEYKERKEVLKDGGKPPELSTLLNNSTRWGEGNLSDALKTLIGAIPTEAVEDEPTETKCASAIWESIIEKYGRENKIDFGLIRKKIVRKRESHESMRDVTIRALNIIMQMPSLEEIKEKGKTLEGWLLDRFWRPVKYAK